MASKKAMRTVAEIPAHQKELLQRSTPSAADIFSNMSAFSAMPVSICFVLLMGRYM